MALRHVFLWLGLCTAASLPGQADPAWWGGVLTAGPHTMEQNYAPLLSGQAKNLADQARMHLNTQLAALGGAGQQINEMCAAWPSHAPDAYTPVSVGQLKALADAFFARLDTVGFNYKSQLINNGYGGAWTGQPARPWNENASAEENYAPALVGQAKLLFAWDATGFTAPLPPGGDLDGDGIPNGVETASGSDPADYYSQGGALIRPRIFVYSGGNQFTPANQYSAAPIVFKVVNAATNAPLASAPVTLSVSSGTGKLALTSGGAVQSELQTVADAQGLAKAFFKAQ